ncbi:racemase [Bombiscardovia nodaiensis]|uniref:Racemase n=1 Tax=Bombiscardovia nodaiensis TaxID=2932181 RepID=A0ABM8B7H2_9BIFI|nr:racemase [Bombiscardovia nodaiensis]
MKTIGLIGGMSWESSAEYYRILNEVVKRELGGLHSARCILYSVDFDEIERYQFAGQWDKAGEVMAGAARSLEAAGADCLAICTNTMHKLVPQVEDASSLPLLHIAQMTADQLKLAGISKVGLLGTTFTMEQDFYKTTIASNGIEVIVPDADDRRLVNDVIYQELCLGEIKDSSRRAYVEIIDKLASQGAQGVILGCTEIGLLVKQADTQVPLFDTTLIHAEGIAQYALS